MEFRNQRPRGRGDSTADSSSRRRDDDSGGSKCRDEDTASNYGSGSGSRRRDDDSCNYSSGPKRRDDKGGRSTKRRGTDEDRSSFSGRSTRSEYKPGTESSTSDVRRPATGASKAFSDDLRLSVLVRRVTRADDDRERRLSFVKQFKEFLLTPDNFTSAQKASESLFSALTEIFHERTSREIKQEVAQCLGIVGYISSSESTRYFDVIFQKILSEREETSKLLLLASLLETLQQDANSDNLHQLMPLIVSKCQTVLENADTPDMLIAVVNIISHIVKTDPHCFQPHFRDTVDILVGWHIDSTQKDELIDFTSNALVGFHQFWCSDVPFSITLLGQFLEDMEAYVEDLLVSASGGDVLSADGSPFEPDECVVKIASLFRVFTTVVLSLSDDQNVNNQYLLDIVGRLMKCVIAVVHNSHSQRTLIAANNCVKVLLGKLGSDIGIVRPAILEFVSSESCLHLHNVTHSYQLSLLSLLAKLIELFGTQLTPEFLSAIMGSESVLGEMCLSSDKQVVDCMLTVYQSIMLLRSVPLLQEAYKCVLTQLESAYNVLLCNVDSETRCNLWKSLTVSPPGVSSTAALPVVNNDGSVLLCDSAETVIVFCICVIAEVGNAKNNIIAMWALSPSIFTLFNERLLLTNVVVMENYPTMHYALIQAFYSHCSRHNNFILVSHLVTQNSALEGNLLANVSATNANNLTCILSMLSELLMCLYTPEDTRCLLLKWTTELTDEMQSSAQIYSSQGFTQLIIAVIATAYNPCPRTTVMAASCLRCYLHNASKQPTYILDSCLHLICVRLSDTDNEVRHVYFKLLHLLPLPVVTRLPCSLLVSVDYSGLLSAVSKDGWYECYENVVQAHMTRTHSGTFHSHNFNAVMSHILQGSNKLAQSSWLERQFFSCQRSPDKELSPNNVSPRQEMFQLSFVADRNSRLLWFWALWEASQFCVLSRLRTPLGKPQDTFAGIETAIKQCRAAINDQETSSTTGLGLETSCQRTFLLIDLMEYLERHLYNAIEGCAVAMAPPAKTVRTFFYTNRATCREWLNRNILSLMIIAKHNNNPATVVRYGFQVLSEHSHTHLAQGDFGEFEQILVLLVEALCQLRAPEAVQGLLVWSREVTGRRMNWIKSTVDIASARYEPAVTSLKACLQVYINPDSAANESRESSPFSSPMHTSGSKKEAASLTKVTLLSKANSEISAKDSHVINCIVKQVCESYVKVKAWEEALKWQDTVTQYSDMYTGTALHKAFNTGIDTNYLRALSHYDSLQFDAVKTDLSAVPSLIVSADVIKSTPINNINSWLTANSAVDLAEQTLLRSITLLHTHNIMSHVSSSVCDWLSWSQSTCESVLRLSYSTCPTFIDNKAFNVWSRASMCLELMNSVDTASTTASTANGALSEKVYFDSLEHDICVPLSALQNLKLQESIQTCIESNIVCKDMSSRMSVMRLAAASLARRQSNFSLCERLLIEELNVNKSVDKTSPNDNNSEPVELLSLLSHRPTLYDTTDISLLTRKVSAEREAAKLLYGRGQTHDAIESLVGTVCRTVGQPMTVKLSAVSELDARSLLSLAKWLQSDVRFTSHIASELNDNVGDHTIDDSVSELVAGLRILCDLEATGAAGGDKLCLELSATNTQMKGCDCPADSDLIVGRLLHLSTLRCPKLAKSWFTLAGWCYKWGRKAVDTAAHGSVELTADEKTRVLELLPDGINLAETESVFSVLGHILTGSSATNDEDISDQDQTRCDDGTETIRRQLVSCSLLLQLAGDSCIEQLIDVWRSIVHRVYHYYQLSAKAYFDYLQLNANTSSDIDMDGNITATLRLLRLLVKHAWELRDILEQGFAASSTAPWKGIIPQLFSRLNHPEPYVRLSVSDLLCRVAVDSPHLIVYPAVVGYSSGKDSVKDDTHRDGLLNEYLSQDEISAVNTDNIDSVGAIVDDAVTSQEDDLQTDDRNVNVIQNCFASILDTLAVNNPRMINEVQLFVSELRRITLLWDELWLGALSQLYQDVMRRLKQLENEVAKVVANTTLTADEAKAIINKKHITILKPTVYSMEQLKQITSRPAETPHEIAFQEAYNKLIETSLESLRCPVNPENPNSTWLVFKQLHHSLQQRAQKRTGQVLNMQEISTKLSDLKHTVIALPGLQSTMGQVVTIESIHTAVQILPTKTKPKKLIFIGSDGLRYSYLFKGLEDLHLDERVMQLLSIINNMFVKNKSERRKLYRARHYSVTPLGARSGLIQWVDGATPMFSLYKRWHQRDVVVKQQQQQQSVKPVSSVAPPTVPRPSELFYGKLNPLLREKGITNTENRKDWPLSVLRKVLEELTTETPNDLLAKEMWCSSSSSADWWLMTQIYARSMAVMSTVGYIIGLGDRHLDNLLIDLSTGEVVHIDYNVCFEKGKSLRVPERVPFRMTQNLETALGLTGVEGTFRLSCEHVMRTLRRGRETLLTLLEAFVYDPLVDWTVGGEWGGGSYTGAFYGGGHQSTTSPTAHRQNRRDMERDITIDMFSIRVAESKATWINNRDELLSSVKQLKTSVNSLSTALTTLQQTEQKHLKLTNQMNYLTQAESAEQDHPIHSLAARYKEYLMAIEQKTEVLKAIDDKLNECEQYNKTHEYAISAIRGSKLQHMNTEIANTNTLTTLAGFTPVIEFLQSAGQQQLVAQCEQLCCELQSTIQQHRLSTRTCLDTLLTYGTIVSHFPRSFEKRNRCYRWQQWLQTLICQLTSNRVQRILSEMHSLYSVTSSPHVHAQYVVDIEHRLQAVILDSNLRLHKSVELLTINSVDSAGSQLQNNMTTIAHFLQEQGPSGTLSLTSVILMELCAMCRQCLDIEAAVAVDVLHMSGSRSPSGLVFLDQLINTTSIIQLLVQLLSDPYTSYGRTSDVDTKCIEHITATHNLYLSLQELYFNFCGVIIPEGLTAVQAEEPSVVAIIASLNELVECLGRPINVVIERLESLIVNLAAACGAVSALSTDDEQLLLMLKTVRTKFDGLYESCNGASIDGMECAPDQGQMLLMGLAGMFSKLDTDLTKLHSVVSGIHQPDYVHNIDTVREAHVLQTCPVPNDYILNLLSLLFFAKQLKIMLEFFEQCHQMANTLLGSVGGSYYDDEQFVQTIKVYICDYLNHHVAGRLSATISHIVCDSLLTLSTDGVIEGLLVTGTDPGSSPSTPSAVSLQQLCSYNIESSLSHGQLNVTMYEQTRQLLAGALDALNRVNTARKLELLVEQQKSTCQRVHLQLMCYQWLHEDILTSAGHQPGSGPRAALMIDLKKAMHALVTHERDSLLTVQSRYELVKKTVIQRLKWAAGANPSLAQTLQLFEDALAVDHTSIENLVGLSNEVLTIGKSVLHFEALMTRTQEAIAADSSLLLLLNRCETCCLLLESTGTIVTETEASLMEMQSLVSSDETLVCSEWIETLLQHVTNELTKTSDSLDTLNTVLDTARENVKTHVNNIRTVLVVHHRLMSDMRVILKAMAKQEEQDYGPVVNVGGIRAYLSEYKLFSEQFTSMLKTAYSDQLTYELCQFIEQLIDTFNKQIHKIYNGLVTMAPPVTDTIATAGQTVGELATVKPVPLDVSVNRVQSVVSVSKDKVSRDPKTGKAMQERNSYAVGVWRRVKLKLDGRDVDVNKRMSVAEQVEYIIHEATNLDNLAVLYEGWTAWV